jgi:hypothetical protein
LRSEVWGATQAAAPTTMRARDREVAWSMPGG